MPRASRSDVARHAGVAPTTVSNVLNGRAEDLRISPETAQRVRDSAARLGYIPRASARALRGGRSHTIGLLLAALPPTPYVPVVYDVLTAAMARTQEHDHLVLPVAQPTEGTGTAYVDRIMADVDLAGVICEYSDRNREAGRRLAELDVPVVWMSFTRKEHMPIGLAHVVADEQPGTEAVLSRVELPRGRRIVAIVGPVYRPDRLDVARRLFGRRLRIVEAETWLPEAGAEAMRQVLREEPKLHTVFCADDLLALGALQACAEGGVSVPGQVSVIGYGGYPLTENAFGRLTTVAWPLRELTFAAVDVLMEHLKGGGPLRQQQPAPLTTLVPTTPVFGTTAALADMPEG
ncbi:LacI family DNA-binding transcriptional regulator [Streptomyces sp. NPDC050421]|uniref:LacI family DNA-binding transcriptional regulator n=1 Tax=unclassified Streptomyces TaxID=2593676 RepID=UPI0037B226D4